MSSQKPPIKVDDSTEEGEASVFEKRELTDIHDEIQNVYQEDERPWVIGYSGGKDSTTALQLIWYAIQELPANHRNKPVYVISSDTLVETPKIVDHIISTLESINEFAEKKKKICPLRRTK